MTTSRGADPVADALIRLVGALGRGDRLPSERTLAATLGVPRSTLRDRLQALEALGAVRRRAGAGTCVETVPPETLSAVLTLALRGRGLTRDSLQVLRVALEREAAEQAARHGDARPLADLRVAVERMDAAKAPDELYAADIDFHAALLTASRSPSLIFVGDALHPVLDSSRDDRLDRMRRLAGDPRRARSVHRAIYDAVLKHDGPRAMRAVDEHFAVASRTRSTS